MKLTDQQSVEQRIDILQEALAKVLDRDGTMSVEWDGSTQYVWVTAEYADTRSGHDLYQIARELEVLLS